MDPRSRLTLSALVVVLGILLVGYGGVALTRWRTAELALQNASRPEGIRSSGVKLLTPAPPTPVEEGIGSSDVKLLAPSSPDTDGDGLPDHLETIYRTDRAKSDTDGDGFLDGSEVANGYDPTKPAPGDKVILALPTPQGPTYTQRYFDRVGLPPSRENLVKSGELEAFVASVNVQGFLPAVRDDELRVVAQGGKAAVAAYLDTISLPQNARLATVKREDIESAFRALTEKSDASSLERLIAGLATNSDILRQAPVPHEALTLHKQYLAATLTLKENVELLKTYQTDFVGVLVAASRIDNLRGVFQSVAEDIKALEKKYNIT